MTTQTAAGSATTPFTPAQWQALHTLRWRYWRDHDLFSGGELAHLRWLYQAGRLGP